MNESENKVFTLEPNEYGNMPCPYCDKIFTPILREWMKPPRVTDYICHWCKMGFKIKPKDSLNGIMRYL